MSKSENACTPMKLYWPKQLIGHIWPRGYSLLIPSLSDCSWTFCYLKLRPFLIDTHKSIRVASLEMEKGGWIQNIFVVMDGIKDWGLKKLVEWCHYWDEEHERGLGCEKKVKGNNFVLDVLGLRSLLTYMEILRRMVREKFGTRDINVPLLNHWN